MKTTHVQRTRALFTTHKIFPISPWMKKPSKNLYTLREINSTIYDKITDPCNPVTMLSQPEYHSKFMIAYLLLLPANSGRMKIRVCCYQNTVWHSKKFLLGNKSENVVVTVIISTLCSLTFEILLHYHFF